jgi:hypothetical protein
MSNLQIFVIFSAFVMTGLSAWYCWFALKAQTHVALSASGTQEVAITVKGGYTPDVIVVQKGRPVRLTFTRQESSACSEKVLFPDFNQNELLSEGEQVTLEFISEKNGRVRFSMPDGNVTWQFDCGISTAWSVLNETRKNSYSKPFLHRGFRHWRHFIHFDLESVVLRGSLKRDGSRRNDGRSSRSDRVLAPK